MAHVSRQFEFERVTLAAFHPVDPTGGGRNCAIIRRIPANRFFEIATSAIWNATVRAWPTTFAPILISFSSSVVSDQSLIGSGVAHAKARAEPSGDQEPIWVRRRLDKG